MTEPHTEFQHLRAILTVGVVTFIGRYRRDLEAANWHYYETDAGRLVHFRKEHMVAVLEGDNINIEFTKTVGE